MEAINEGFRFLKGKRTVQSVFLADLNAMIFGFPVALLPGGRAGAGAWSARRRCSDCCYAAPAAARSCVTLALGQGERGPRAGRAIMLVDRRVGRRDRACSGSSTRLWLSLLMLAVAGAGDMVSGIFRMSILQTATEERYRGRLDGIGMAVWATGPSLGDVESGVVASI